VGIKTSRVTQIDGGEEVVLQENFGQEVNPNQKHHHAFFAQLEVYQGYIFYIKRFGGKHKHSKVHTHLSQSFCTERFKYTNRTRKANG